LGGKIYEQSAAVEIKYGEPNVVRTAKGQVRAKYLLIAGNAYLPQGLDNRVTAKSMPCGSQIVVTEPLTEKQARSLITNNYCVEDCNYLLDYYRLTADNRLLYGGGVVYGAREPDDIEQLIRPKILKTFPQLKDVKIDYRWTGNFLLTMSRMPQFGRIEKERLLHARLQRPRRHLLAPGRQTDLGNDPWRRRTFRCVRLVATHANDRRPHLFGTAHCPRRRLLLTARPLRPLSYLPGGGPQGPAGFFYLIHHQPHCTPKIKL
jgi:hypothetical protein